MSTFLLETKYANETRYSVIVEYVPGATSCWTRLNSKGEESEGARMDREIYQKILPCTLEEIEQKAVGHQRWSHPLNHIHWAVLKGYMRFNTNRTH